MGNRFSGIIGRLRQKNKQPAGEIQPESDEDDQDKFALIPHKVSLNKPFKCNFPCPLCNEPCKVAAESRERGQGGLTEQQVNQGHRECWCKANDEIEYTRRSLRNSQLLEAAHNGTLSMFMQRKGKEGTSTRRDFFDSENGDLKVWVKKRVKLKAHATAPAGEDGEEEETEERDKIRDQAVDDLCAFLHVLDVRAVEDLQKKVDVEVLTFKELEAVVVMQEKSVKTLEKKVKDKVGDAEQCRENKKKKTEEQERLERLEKLQKDPRRCATLRLMRRELKRVLAFEQVLDHLLRDEGRPEERADPNVFDRNGITPLHYAARNGNCNDIRLLLDYNADPTIADGKGNSVLHFAAMYAPGWSGDDGNRGSEMNACPLCGVKHKSSACERMRAVKVLVKAYDKGLARERAKKCATCAAKGGRGPEVLCAACMKGDDRRITCKNSTDKSPKDVLIASITPFEEQAKKIEKERKKGGDFFDALTALFDGLKATDTEERFLENGHHHSDRVKEIAKSYFTKLPKIV